MAEIFTLDVICMNDDRLINRMTIDEFKIQVLPLKNRLYRIAFRVLGRQEEAEDMVQDTLVRLWKDRDRLNGYRSVEAFAVVICRNLSLDRVRSKKFRHDPLPEAHQDSGAATPEKRTEMKDTLEKVHQLIGQLPELQRTIIQMRDIEEMEYEEMADMLNMNVNAIRVNLARARKKVRDSIIKYHNYELARN